jgi:mono/diheme cytochrome c family protein
VGGPSAMNKDLTFTSRRRIAWQPLAALIFGIAIPSHAVGNDDDGVRADARVRQILDARCVKCHGALKREGGLDLRRDLTMLQGGDSGPAVVPGKPDESLLVQRVESGEMPPTKNGKLDKEERVLLRRWVSERALRPTAAQDGPPAPNEREIGSTVTDDDRRFWAFQSPERPVQPRVGSVSAMRTPIDAFLLARLEARGLTFNPEVPREVLLRRVCFDLLGLPPTLEQQEQFLKDDRALAYEHLVDRLLASPAYGERWGRHWLDVAGYADSDGGLAADRARPQAWRYRDYVIKALNRDMPFDQFLTEQIAGDELSDWRGAQTLSDDAIRQLTATGFLRTASDPTYPGYTEPNEIHQVLADTMQIVGSTFLGITLQCARCHAHKFDPISQRDYYGFQAIFLPALDPGRWQPSEVRGIPLAADRELARIKAENDKVTERTKAIETTLAALNKAQRQRRIDELVAGQPAALKSAITTALEVPVEKRNPKQQELVARLGPAGATALDESALAARDARYKQESEAFKAQIAAESARRKPDPVLVRGVTDLPGQAPQGRIMKRGDFTKPGAPVAPSVPAVLAASGYRLIAPSPARSTGRRLTLARWMTAPDHPLTARVQINRLWAHHFGRGLVPTTANFGHAGARPSHPELLDWLAIELVRSGWSLKAMHRLMLTSSAYRQSSQADARQTAIDPENVLLGRWRPRRLEGEALRDSILAVGGSLNPTPFGPPTPVIAKDDGSVETANDAAGNRRSIYLAVRRSQHLTLLDLFDTPVMEVNCPERVVSTVPLQSLALLHGPFAERNAAALANRICDCGGDDPGSRLRYAYRLLFARDPTPREVALVARFQSGLIEPPKRGGNPAGAIQHRLATRAAWVQTALVLLNSNEFVYVN